MASKKIKARDLKPGMQVLWQAEWREVVSYDEDGQTVYLRTKKGNVSRRLCHPLNLVTVSEDISDTQKIGLIYHLLVEACELLIELPITQTPRSDLATIKAALEALTTSLKLRGME